MSTQTVRVLVVDDILDVTDMIVMLLQLFRHEAKAVYSGQSALETALNINPTSCAGSCPAGYERL